ncbi:MAG: autotransporter-associated beta strand repeat-containing protein [Luteolibacter sp.]
MRKFFEFPSARSLATCLTIAALSPSAFAGNGTWATTVLGGVTTWDATGNWTGGSIANGTDAVATFNQDFSANLQFTFSSPVTIGEINVTDTSATNPDRGVWFDAGTLIFDRTTGTPTITITADTSGGNHDIPLRFNGAAIQGNRGLLINLLGENYNGLSAGARFSGGSWSGFSGPVTFQSGRFRVEAANNTLPANSEIIMGNGTWFQIVRGYTGGLGSQSIRGLSGGDGTTLVGAENSANDPAAAGTLTLGANSLAGDSYTFSGILGGDMFGTGTPNTNFSLTKTGPSTQRLAGNNLYIGTTTVNGGTVLVNGTHNQGTGANAGRYLVQTGGILGGNGTINLSDTSGGTTGFSVSGTLAPGDPATNNGIGTLTISGTNSVRSTLAFETGGTLAMQLGAGNASDRIALTGAAAQEIYFNNNTIGFTDTTAGGLTAGQYILFSADAANAYSGLTIDGSGFITAGFGIGAGLGAYPGSVLKVVGNNIVLNLVVPSGPPPDAPVSLTASNGFDQIPLSWSAVAGAGSYTVKRSTTPGSGYTDIASAITGTTYNDTTVTPGVTYYYVVVAVNGNGESTPSPESSAVSNVRTAVGVNLRAYNSYGMPFSDLVGVVRKACWNNLVGPSLTGEVVSLGTLTNDLGETLPGMSLTWTAGSTGGNYTSSGTIKFGPDAVTVNPLLNDGNLYSSAVDQYDGTPGTLSVTGIPYSSYDLVFYVYDDGATRGGSITANGSTLSIRGGLGNPTSAGTGYTQSTDSINTSGTSVQQGNYVRFTGLGGNLNVSMLAKNMGSSTQRLKIAGFQILNNDPNPPATIAPASPTGLTSSAGNRQVALNWNTTPTATDYRIYKNGGLLASVPAPLLSYADTGVSNGTGYSYTLSAVNVVGESPQSAAAVATPAAPAFTPVTESVYQFSIPVTAIFSNRAADPQRRAYLWVPPGCAKLQGVMVGLHNMLEKPMFDDPVIRQACAEADLGIVFISPGDAKTWTPNGVGNYTPGLPTTAVDLDPNGYGKPEINPATGLAFSNTSEQAGAELAQILSNLGTESGYTELQYAPILMTGHSAASPFVWARSVHTSAVLVNRVFAILPYKGTHPGSVPDGVPVFHVASELQEISSWGNTWELGDASPMRGLRSGGSNRLVGEAVQPGAGHYNHSFTQSGMMGAFIKGSAAARIPANWSPASAPVLNSVSPESGWVIDVRTLGSGSAQAVSYATWTAAGNDPLRAYWYPDQATAEAVANTANEGFSKRPQLINAYTNGSTLAALDSQANGAGTVSFTPTLQPDGYSFQVRAASMNQSPVPRAYNGAPLGMATGSIRYMANLSGAMRQTGADTFRVWMDRGSVIKTGQPWEPFILAYQPGDSQYRAAWRPIWINTSVPVNNNNSAYPAQTITFPTPPDQIATGLANIALSATASSALPVQYWVASGPFHCDPANNDVIVPDSVPVKTKWPARVMIGAWQWGRVSAPTVQAAPVVFKTFWIHESAFAAWQYDKFGSMNANGGWNALPATAAPDADPDGDGRTNMMEYATGTLPSTSDTGPAATGGTADPGNGLRLTLSFNRIADPSLTYQVEASDELASGTWGEIWSSTGAENTAGMVAPPVTDTVTMASRPKRFLRLRLTR